MNATPLTSAKWLSRAQTAEVLNVTPRTVDRYIARGYIRATKLGTQTIRIDAASVESFLRNGAVAL